MKALRLILFAPILIIPALFSEADAQEFTKNKEKFSDNLFFGGGLGLQFGTLTLIDLSPIVGYRVTEKFETGLGLTYKYYRYKDYYIDYYTGISYDLKSNILGGSVFARYHILDNVFAHAEFESLRYNYTSYYSSGTGLLSEPATAIINSLFVGGGYRQRISQGSYFYIMALWNLNQDALSPYDNPVLRMGVILGR
ncbi:hypothetical protein TBC1_11809 [Lentimicrobium saccharophilum]|uniref:Outer membrane protein beta-barrel domain n=1 Tax=Lentimicrobium saccharophilum TaxID=1678841 RepID=A0A0S7BPR9_9BACT|nr:hypothetical protein [Lentimicrobium saccharophilum]GAP42677.1 hypothetical protein TBC1_11809 [Lentimicrobium saccharophilum]